MISKCTSSSFARLLARLFYCLLLCGFLSPFVFPQLPPGLPDAAQDQLLIQFRSDAAAERISELLGSIDGVVIRRFRLDPKLYLIKLPQPERLPGVLDGIRRSREVNLADVDHLIYPSAVPNDPKFSQQWSFSTANDIDLDAPEAWDISQGSQNVTVAIIDNGIDINHEDLVSNIWTNPGEVPGNGVDDDGNGYIDDIHGWNFVSENNILTNDCVSSHATAIAGIIGAKGNNSKGIAGVNWNVRLMVAQAFNPASNCGALESDLIAALDYATENGARITNNSYGFTSNLPLVKQAFDRAEQAGVLAVVAAGNAARNNDTSASKEYPCSYANQNILCVAAADKLGNLAGFSNFGINSVDVAAPGVDIFSSLTGNGYGEPAPSGGLGDNSGNGTSFATPHVTGVAALMAAVNPTYTYLQLKENLMLAAQPTSTGNLANKTQSGNLVNARAAVRAFGDSFDDAASDKRFFSDSPTNLRWAVAQNGGSRCDNLTKTVSGTSDRVVRAHFNATTWTLGAYRLAYPPGGNVQTVLLRVTTTDGSTLPGKKGRIGTGLIGDTGQTNKTCAATGKIYREMSFGGSAIGGIDLTTGRPFVYFNPPYSQTLLSPVDLTGVKNLSISVAFGSASVTLFLSNSDNGATILAPTSIPYPGTWNWTGTDKAAFIYYPANGETGNNYLNVRSFVSVR